MPLHIPRRALPIGLLALMPSDPAAAQGAGPMTAEIAQRLGLPLGNPTFTPEGRLFVSHHPMFETDTRVSEATAPDALRPFPNARWNSKEPPPSERLDAVLGIRADAEGKVWMLDMGSRSQIPPKFVVWDTRADQLHRVLPITPSTLGPYSEPNDFVIDSVNGAAFIADEGVGKEGDGSEGALIVVNLASGLSRRVLAGTASTRAEPVPIVVGDRQMIKQSKDGSKAPMRVGCDGLAVDHRSEWLYHGPLSGGAVHRVRVADLLDGTLGATDLAGRVERYADRPNCGGIAIDSEDNLYLTEVGGFAVGVIPARDRQYRRYAAHPDMLWPDGLTFGTDGMLYVTVAQLPLSAPLNGGTRADRSPHLIMRFPPLAPGRIGN